MSYERRYLERLVPALSEAFGHPSIALKIVGLRGSSSTFAAHHVDRVLAEAPDMVLLEFSINDDLLEREEIEHAMHGIIERIRESFPECDLMSVQFAAAGEAVRGPTAAMQAQEAIAERYAFPSMDLAAVSEWSVAQELCSWQGPERALTTDGVHHSALAEEVVGGPFADAFVALLQSAVGNRPVAPPQRTNFYHARRIPIATLLSTGDGWRSGPPEEAFAQYGQGPAFIDTVATATRPGAMFRCAYTGTDVILWACTTGGHLRITLNGTEIEINVPADPIPRFRDYRIGPLPHENRTLIVEALTPNILLGDIFYFGDPT